MIRRALLLLLLAGCQPRGHAEPLPETPKPGEPRDRCVSECVQARQMEARAIEAIEADCRRECARSTPDGGARPTPPR